MDNHIELNKMTVAELEKRQHRLMEERSRLIKRLGAVAVELEIRRAAEALAAEVAALKQKHGTQAVADALN